MTWLKVVLALISLARLIANSINTRNLMEAGEAKATAESLAALSARLGIAQLVAAEVAALSDAELDAELRGD